MINFKTKNMENLIEKKAKKKYSCYYCGRPISKGEKHILITNRHYYTGKRFCERCKPIIINDSILIEYGPI